MAECGECGAMIKTPNGIWGICRKRTCKEHAGFYEPSRWLRWLDDKTGGDVSKCIVKVRFSISYEENPFWNHIRDSLTNGKVVITKDSLRVLPGYMLVEESDRGYCFIYHAFLTQPQIRYEWCPRLWRKMAFMLLNSYTTEFQKIVNNLIKTPDDFIRFMDIPCNSQKMKNAVNYIINKRPEWWIRCDDIIYRLMGFKMEAQILSSRDYLIKEKIEQTRRLKDELIARVTLFPINDLLAC